jgi:hypothetical protein
VGSASDERILPPAIRIPELVERGRLRRDELIHVQVEIMHPSRTGLALRDGKFVRESAPLYLKELEVFYGGERVSRFEMTSAVSDDPLITFALLARREDPLRVVFTNNREQRLEATHELRLA